ncbi:hypothetical protein V6N11_030218 [Hibiscus sabdariffa]|uniref:Uncharacterized protein n=1 Tax=Hibiscus sabdariffa TaxID=183260 RepID=A0ABR2PK85_9ROSI
MKLALVTFLLVSLVLGSFFFEESMAGFCGYKCKARCSKAEFKERAAAGLIVADHDDSERFLPHNDMRVTNAIIVSSYLFAVAKGQSTQQGWGGSTPCAVLAWMHNHHHHHFDSFKSMYCVQDNNIQLTLPESDVATMSCKAPERTAVISEAKPTQQVGEEKRKETRYAQGIIDE